MLKSLRVPERLFRLAMWLVSFVFASFLIGLGDRIVGDLPGVRKYVTLDQFLDSVQVRRINHSRDSLSRVRDERTAAADRARLTLAAAQNAYRSRRESFANWIATRRATTDPRTDPAVLSRTRELDTVNANVRSAQSEVDRLDAGILDAAQATERLDRERIALDERARTTYERARFVTELRVFLIRLALTLPLLLIAGWLIVRKRTSQYWPLARGFVLFALFAFFVELVPYLPSYGGYVRNAVGVIATAVAGVYLTRAMRRYLARRAEAERRTESERRQALDYEEGIRRITAGVCPGCERAIAQPTNGAPVNFCVHCGMTLYDTCAACGARKNAFFQHCPVCGATTAAAKASEAVVG